MEGITSDPFPFTPDFIVVILFLHLSFRELILFIVNSIVHGIVNILPVHKTVNNPGDSESGW